MTDTPNPNDLAAAEGDDIDVPEPVRIYLYGDNVATVDGALSMPAQPRGECCARRRAPSPSGTRSATREKRRPHWAFRLTASGTSFRQNENPARASQRGGVSEPSVECIEIISCYEGSACETCRRHRGSCGNPREDTSSLFAPLKRAPCSHAADPASPKGKPHHWAKVVAGFPAPVLLGSEISFGATGATLAGGDVFRKPSRPDRITVSIRTLGAAK
jgi:hypothetical protein